LAILFFSDLSGQIKRAQNWTFSHNNGFDFSTGTPQLTTSSTFTTAGFQGGGGAISNENGNLVCYSNGSNVWQPNGTIMMGGAGLAGNSMATQSAIIVPSVTSSTRYYVFTNSAQSLNIELNYYDVELTLNGGNGMVIGPTLLLNPSTEKLAATRHGNDKDYWVVAHKYNSDEFHAFLIDENGVNGTPVISAVGVSHLSTAGGGEYQGALKISPDGQWLITCNFASGNVQLFKFNNVTGQVSDPITLTSGNTVFPYGAEFSADSKKVYYSRKASNSNPPFGVHQFDLDHASIDCLLSSEQIVSNGNEFKPYADMQLGPDKKIYLFPVNTYIPNIDTLGALTTPEKVCPDCGFEDQHIQTSNNVTGGGVNFVSSFLSDGIKYEFGSNCEFDTTWFSPEDTLALDSVHWNFGDPSSGMNTSSAINAGHVFSSPDTFLVTLVTYRGTLADTFTRNVIIWDVDYNLIGLDTTICNGQPITLDATWYNACIEWNDGTTNNTLPVSAAGTYWADISYQSCVWRDSIDVILVNNPPQFTLGNDTLVCSNASFMIDPNLPNAYYSWQDGSTDTTFEVTSTGVYWLAATNACGTAIDTINVELNQAAQPVLDFPEDTTLCNTATLILDVTFENAAYQWNDGSSQSVKEIDEAGSYWVTVGNVCDTVSDTINVFFDDPLVSALDKVDLLCEGPNTIIISATTEASPVLWSTGSFASSIQITSPGTYSYIDSNQCGSLLDTIQILQWDSTYVLRIGEDTILCDEETEIETGDFQQDYPWKYTWNTDETAPTISTNAGNYILTASNRCAEVEVNRFIDVSPTVTINEVVDRTVCEGKSLLLSLSSDVLSVNWSNGETGSEIEARQAGVYFVEIIDSNGCIQEDSIALDDDCPGLVFPPNVFSPNGDGINDEFCIALDNIIDYQIFLLDRWGTQVFYSENDTKCWDGVIRGKRAAAGTYFYVVEVEDAKNEKASYRGSFTLLD